MEIAFKRGRNCHLSKRCTLRSFSSGSARQLVTSRLVGQILRVILEHHGGGGEKAKERGRSEAKAGSTGGEFPASLRDFIASLCYFEESTGVPQKIFFINISLLKT